MAGASAGLASSQARIACIDIRSRGIAPISAELEYVPSTMTELPEDQANEVLELVDRLEQDDDVQRVFHNLA